MLGFGSGRRVLVYCSSSYGGKCTVETYQIGSAIASGEKDGFLSCERRLVSTKNPVPTRGFGVPVALK